MSEEQEPECKTCRHFRQIADMATGACRLTLPKWAAHVSWGRSKVVLSDDTCSFHEARDADPR